MNTQVDLTLSKGPNKVKAPQTNEKRIVLILAGLVLVLLTGLLFFNRPNGTQPQAEQALPAVPYNNALEMQYAQPWLEAQNKPAIPYSNALEMQYARPWLDAQEKAEIPFGNALEMQYAQPWLDAQKSLDCHSRLDLFYACQNGLNINGK